MTEAASPFSTIQPHFQTAWDSTSLGWLKTCAKQYQYHMLWGYHPRALNVHLWFGGLYAAGLERYARWRAEGQSHDHATREMVRWALCASWVTGPGAPDGAPGPGADAPSEGHPYETGDSVKNRYTLIRSLVWNVDEHEHSPFATMVLANRRAAVEYSFRFHAFDIGEEEITLCGHLDRVVTEPDGQPWVLDDKTTGGALGSNYFRQYSPNGQMSLYTIAARTILSVPARGVLVRAAQIGVNFTRFQTAQVPRPKAVLDEWLDDTAYWIGQAQSHAREGHWPMNDKSCFLCPFKEVCSKSPTHRGAWLEQDFERYAWNPLEPRGDL